MPSGSFPVLLRDPSAPGRVYAGRAEVEEDGVLFVCGREPDVMRRWVAAEQVVEARRGGLRLRGRSAVELVLRSGRRLDVAVLAIGGLSQLLEALAALPAAGA